MIASLMLVPMLVFACSSQPQYSCEPIRLLLQTAATHSVSASVHGETWTGWRRASTVVTRSDRFQSAEDWEIGRFPEHDLACVRSTTLGVFECMDPTTGQRLGLLCE